MVCYNPNFTMKAEDPLDPHGLLSKNRKVRCGRAMIDVGTLKKVME